MLLSDFLTELKKSVIWLFLSISAKKSYWKNGFILNVLKYFSVLQGQVWGIIGRHSKVESRDWFLASNWLDTAVMVKSLGHWAEFKS